MSGIGVHRVRLEDLPRLRDEVEQLDASQLVSWAAGQFGNRLVLASSFSAEDMALIDIVRRADVQLRVFTLDTGRLHQETYDMVEEVRKRYALEVDLLVPEQADLESLLRADGPNGFYRSVAQRRRCCEVRKVQTLQRYLKSASAWITGTRRSQSVTRSDLERVQIDWAHGGLLKISPLAHWSSEEVWAYVRKHRLPIHALHEKGYPSIGCAPCTRAVAPGEPHRSGRWWWEDESTKECGLHRSAEEPMREKENVEGDRAP
jgi:phosphoadenosine phosphosulfate reductase